jgi:pimeloyl-ACP methyl ester carboxylesterase
LIVQNLLAQPTLNAVRVDRNVVFGMYSGLALLMDVYYPENPNGYGIIQISGSGWSKPLSYDSKMLNHQRHVKLEGEMFVEAGYTLDKFGINPDRIGAIGGSSGGHLVSLLGVLDGNEIPADDTPINRMSAKLQCVIARAAPTDFLYSSNGVYFSNSSNGQYFLNVKVKNKPFTIEYKIAQMASPIYHISVDDPPFLLIHGDQDPIVPYVLSENMHNKLLEMNIVSNLITVEGGFHGPGVIDSPEVREKMVQWMDMYLIEK